MRLRISLAQNRVVSVATVALACLVLAPSAAALNSVPSPTLIPNGPVNAIAATPNAIYIGGQFTHVGPFTGPGTGIDASTGRGKNWAPLASRSPSPHYRPRVSDAAPDGAGGFYVAGDFVGVGGPHRSYLIHVRASGRIDRHFNPHPDAPVQAVAVSGPTVYVAGTFTTIGGKARKSLAALDATTGAATDWNPNASGAPMGVEAFAVAGSTVYVGGLFDEIGGKPRHHLAALDASTGTVRPWKPQDVSGVVDALAVSGPTIYVGKSSTHSGYLLDAVDRSSGESVGAADFEGPVLSLAVEGSRLYVGGSFRGIFNRSALIPRPNLAAFSTASHTLFRSDLRSWDPSPNGAVTALAASGSTVYAAGDFNDVGGKTRLHLAAIDRSSGVPTIWNPSADGSPETIALSGETVYVGGRLGSVGGRARSNLAALDPRTGELKPWNPRASGGVYALAVRGSTVYVGGDFGNVDGARRSNIAGIDAISGLPTEWSPDTNGPVRAIAATAYGVYIGGEFTSVSHEPRNNLAKIDQFSGAVTGWNPNVTTTTPYPQFQSFYPSHRCFGADPCLFTLVDAIAIAGSRVYVGGFFDHVGGEPRDNIAALDASNGATKDWHPDASGLVSALGVSRPSYPVVYAGGDFGQIGGEPRANLAALNTADGTATNWDPSVAPQGEGIVSAIALRGPNVYVGGTFGEVGAEARDNLADVNASTGTATSWNPNPVIIQDNLPLQVGLRGLAVGPDSSLWAGGYFGYFGYPTFTAVPTAGIARFRPGPP